MRAAETEGLSVTGLTVSYAGRNAIEGVSFRSAAGTITALVGPNGSGKTTLLRAIAGLVPFRGSVSLDGDDLGVLDPRRRATRVSYVPQSSALEAPLAVEDVVLQGRFAHRGPFTSLTREDRQAASWAMEIAGVAGLAGRPITELSGGERQRVFVGRALATGAELLLLDEPTSAQDIAQVLALRAVLRELASRGRTLLVSLHDLSEVRELADEVIMMSGGRVVTIGAPTAVVSNEHVPAAFGASIVEGGGLGYTWPDGEAPR